MTGETLVLRKAKESDRIRIMELLTQANMHHIPSLEMPEITFDTYTVAEINGRVMGFAGYKILSATEAKTELMVVDPLCRGSGIGIKLQTLRMKQLYSRGIQLLTTHSDIPATISWYKRHFSYQEIGILKKLHEFGDPNVPSWTTLQVDLHEWAHRSMV